MDIPAIVLQIIFAVVGIVLLVALVYLIRTLKTVRSTIIDTKKQLDPTLQNMAELTSSAKPLVVKSEPILDRAALSLDALNLEVMRLDGILENVAEMTTTAQHAVSALDALANAPQRAVQHVTKKVTGVINKSSASDTARKLHEKHLEMLDSAGTAAAPGASRGSVANTEAGSAASATPSTMDGTAQQTAPSTAYGYEETSADGLVDGSIPADERFDPAERNYYTYPPRSKK